MEWSLGMSMWLWPVVWAWSGDRRRLRGEFTGCPDQLAHSCRNASSADHAAWEMTPPGHGTSLALGPTQPFHLIVQLCTNSLTSLSYNSLVVSKHQYNSSFGFPGPGKVEMRSSP